jgi:hypothetical protein
VFAEHLEHLDSHGTGIEKPECQRHELGTMAARAAAWSRPPPTRQTDRHRRPPAPFSRPVETRRSADIDAIRKVVAALEHAQQNELVNEFVSLFWRDAI